MTSCLEETGSRGEPSPKSHQPSPLPAERLWNVTVSPSCSTAKLATGLAGLTTLSSSGDRYIMNAPESSPAVVPRIVLTRPAFLTGSEAAEEEAWLLMGWSSLTGGLLSNSSPGYEMSRGDVERGFLGCDNHSS